MIFNYHKSKEDYQTLVVLVKKHLTTKLWWSGKKHLTRKLSESGSKKRHLTEKLFRSGSKTNNLRKDRKVK
jgi:hypothetical protein